MRAQWTIPKSVEIHDVTLRDGEQTARIVFTPQEKIEIAKELDALGVASIEPGLPATAEDREVISALASMDLHAKVKPLVRVRQEDVVHAIECHADAIVLEFGINPFLLKVVYGVTPDGARRAGDRVLERRQECRNGGRVHGLGHLSHPDPGLREAVLRADPGAGVDRPSDGQRHFRQAHPSAVAHMFGELTSWFPGLPLGLHVHNDFGLATATALVALTSGASSLHTSVNALGERAGNVATEEVAVALEYLLGIDAGIDLSRLDTRL